MRMKTKDDGNVDEIHGQPNRLRNVGRPKGTTKALAEAQRNQERLEQEKRLIKEGVTRSERIKNRQSVMMVKDDVIPRNIEEAKNLNDWKNWRQPMKEELTSMEKHKVWNIVNRPKNKKVIKCKWIFNIKEDPNTGHRRYKARLHWVVDNVLE